MENVQTKRGQASDKCGCQPSELNPLLHVFAYFCATLFTKLCEHNIYCPAVNSPHILSPWLELFHATTPTLYSLPTPRSRPPKTLSAQIKNIQDASMREIIFIISRPSIDAYVSEKERKISGWINFGGAIIYFYVDFISYTFRISNKNWLILFWEMT